MNKRRSQGYNDGSTQVSYNMDELPEMAMECHLPKIFGTSSLVVVAWTVRRELETFAMTIKVLFFFHYQFHSKYIP